MNQRQALAQLRKHIGKDIAWRENPKAGTAEEREAHHAKCAQLREEETAVKAQWEALRQKLLSDPEYVALTERLKTLREEKQRESSFSHAYPLTVGRVHNGESGFRFFRVLIQGDTWEDVVAKASQQHSAG